MSRTSLGGELAPLFLAVLFCACGRTVVLEDQQFDGGTAQDSTTSLGDGSSSLADASSSDGHCSDNQSPPLQFTPASPELVVALDRSMAMNAPFGGDPSQLSSALDALGAQITKLSAPFQSNQPTIRFAFIDFPDVASDCSVAAGCCSSDVMSTTNYAAFKAAAYPTCSPMNGCIQFSERPTAYALSKAQDFLNSQAQTGPRYVLLLTDGPPNGCSPSSRDCSDAIEQIGQLNSLGVQTTIVSIAADSNGGSGCLLNLAVTEEPPGTYPPGAPFYYTASSPSDLNNVLDTIIGTVAEDACRLDLATTPVAPDQITVLLDGATIPRDVNNGWDLDGIDGSHIRLYGTACQDLVEGGAHRFKIFDGCTLRPFGMHNP